MESLRSKDKNYFKTFFLIEERMNSMKELIKILSALVYYTTFCKNTILCRLDLWELSPEAKYFLQMIW